MILFKKLIPSKLKIPLRNFRDRINIAKYRGNNYECPFCNLSVRQFLPYGKDIAVIKEKEIIGAGLRNVKCPKCYSIDRERLMYFYLKNNFSKNFNTFDLKILHIAPKKNLMNYLSNLNFKEYVCGDLFAEGYHYSNFVQKLDVTDLPFEHNYFDFVICNHVLEHINEDTRAMKEIHRVLKKNAQAVLQVPISFKIDKTFEDPKITSSKQREIAFGQRDHVRIYGKDYVSRLESCGFSVEVSNFSAEHKELEYYGINTIEPIFIAMKN